MTAEHKDSAPSDRVRVNPDTRANAPSVAEQVMAVLAARDSEIGYVVTKGYLGEIDVAYVIAALRSLPVEQRAEAMGMVQHDDSCRNDGHGGHWHEA